MLAGTGLLGSKLFFDAQAQFLLGHPDDVFIVEYLQLRLLQLFLQLLDLSGQRIGVLHHLLDEHRRRLFQRVSYGLGTYLLFLSDTFQPLGNG